MLGKFEDLLIKSIAILFLCSLFFPVLFVIIDCSNQKDLSNCAHTSSYLEKTYEYRRFQGDVPIVKEFKVYKCQDTYDTVLIKRYN